MPNAVFGLLVGVNDYRPPIGTPLRGAVADIKRWQAHLIRRFGDAASLLTLTDAAATRTAVIEGFRTHLSHAASGDTAVFIFSGHGSQEQAPPEFVGADASGRLQNLLCFDTGQVVDGVVVRQLADKELSLLLDEVSERGAQVIVILDCCHSGDATRSGLDVARRWVPPLRDQPDGGRGEDGNVLLELWGPRPIEAFLEGTLEHAPERGRVTHVALTACQSTETAREREVDGEWRGLFTTFLLDTVEKEGAIDYRSLIDVVRAQLTALGVPQRPELFPIESGGPGDGVFLGAAAAAGSVLAPFVVTGFGGRWSATAGALHGLAGPTGGDACQMMCIDANGRSCGEVRVVSVNAGSSVVEPFGWLPEAPSYRARISWMPVAEVVLGEAGAADEPAGFGEMFDAIRSAVEGSSSALLRLKVPGTSPSPGAFTLRVAQTVDPSYRGPGVLLSVDDLGGTNEGTGLDARSPSTGIPWDGIETATTVLRRLEHLARWERLRRLGEQRSELVGSVELQIFRASANDRVIPAGLAPLPTAAEHTLAYSADGPPRVFLRLKNASPRDLWVALIDLADDLSATVLRQAEKISAGVELDVDPEGRPWEFALSASVEAVTGGIQNYVSFSNSKQPSLRLMHHFGWFTK